jgi:ATP-binding protein involved in chromosome partitioning
MQNPFDQQKSIPGVKKIIAISSGKGGVGKSTVAANLAAATAKLGFKVGLLDCDIYGPSIPRMFGILGQKPEIGSDQKIFPIKRHDVNIMSIGLLVDDDLAVVWRGPMLFKAVDQFLFGVNWGELDYLYIDLPPGTGDVQLSLAQKVPLAGAIAISTPQDVALSDMKKALDMWARVQVPVLGVVENMSYLSVKDSNGTISRQQLFPKGSLDHFLEEKGIEKLAELAFYPGVAKAAEVGIPMVNSQADSDEAKSFLALAKKICQ